MPSSQSAYLLIALTAVVGGLVALLVFAMLRLGGAARDMRRRARESDTERAFVSAALEDAIKRLREQERAMTARAESSEQLSGEIVASLTSGLLVVGLDGTVKTINPAARRLLRLPVAAEPWMLRTLLADTPALVPIIEECLFSAEPAVRRTIRVSRPDGSEMHLGVTVSPLRDRGGIGQGAICLFSDLTAVVELEEQVRLKESLARLGELTAGLAHEFRNGLATIHGYARLIDPTQLRPDYQPYVQALRDETESLGRVVNNFLNFARPVQLTLAPIDLGDVVEIAAAEVRPDVVARGGAILVSGEFGILDGDEILLRQVLVNLLRNAVEACAPAAIVPRIEIEGGRDAAQRLQRLTVSDNGPGIEPGLRARVFRPFFTTRSQGTGLGLALVQKIVVTHNGRITVGESDSGGAAFHLAFPLSGRR